MSHDFALHKKKGGGGGGRGAESTVALFDRFLRAHAITVTVRRSLGHHECTIVTVECDGSSVSSLAQLEILSPPSS
jgi:hypothetical protein